MGIKINRKLEKGKREMNSILLNSNEETEDYDREKITLYKSTIKKIKKKIIPLKWKILDSLENMNKINRRNKRLWKRLQSIDREKQDNQ